MNRYLCKEITFLQNVMALVECSGCIELVKNKLRLTVSYLKVEIIINLFVCLQHSVSCCFLKDSV